MITREGTVTITRDGGIVATGFHFEGCASLTVASWEIYDWIEKHITQAKLEESRPRPAPCQPLEAGSEGGEGGGVMATDKDYLTVYERAEYAALRAVADAARVVLHFTSLEDHSTFVALAAALNALDGKEEE